MTADKQSAAPPDAKIAAKNLLEWHKHSTQGEWQKGLSTHHTITETGYRIAEFHHADDAQFCDAAHKLVPMVCAALLAPPPIPAGQTLSAQPVASKELSDEQIVQIWQQEAPEGGCEYPTAIRFARTILAASRLDGANAGEKP